MKLRMDLKNLKGVFAHVWLNIGASDRLSFTAIDIEKKVIVDSTPVENLCHRRHVTSRNQGRQKRDSLGTGLPRLLPILSATSQLRTAEKAVYAYRTRKFITHAQYGA